MPTRCYTASSPASRDASRKSSLRSRGDDCVESRGLVHGTGTNIQRTSQLGHNARGGYSKAPAHTPTGSAAPRPVGRLSHRPGRRFTCSFLSGVASRTMTKFVRALAVPKECCSAAGQPQTAPWTLPRRSAPPWHPAGCRRGTRCHPVHMMRRSYPHTPASLEPRHRTSVASKAYRLEF